MAVWVEHLTRHLLRGIHCNTETERASQGREAMHMQHRGRESEPEKRGDAYWPEKLLEEEQGVRGPVELAAEEPTG